MCLTNISTVLLGKQYNDGLFSCSPSLNCTRPETYKHKWPFGGNRNRGKDKEDTEMEETVNQSQLGNAKKDEL